jgi:nondiscriminating glutamyl-tRNA synthetase
LHVGGARTALFNWLFARHHGGQFILRVEDTDAKRSSLESIRAIVDSMSWLGLKWDEGPEVGGPVGPYFQSERAERYTRAAKELHEAGLAYHCYCTEAELDQVREKQQAAGEPVRYNGRCRKLSAEARAEAEAKGVVPALRFRVPEEKVTVPDIVKGPVELDAALYGDLVIMRSTGQAMYNFACVVDDAAMGITHVIRGDEHLMNTPKQMLLYRALGLPEPAFGHLPMILGKDRAKLSKREGATSVEEYQTAGFLPEAMLNYLSLLGWSSGTDEEVFTPDDLIKRFDLGGVSRNPAIFDGTKLNWLNQQHIRKKSLPELSQLVAPYLQSAYGKPQPVPDTDRFHEMLKLASEYLVVLADAPAHMKLFYAGTPEPDTEALELVKNTPGAAAMLAAFRDTLSGLPEWTPDAIKGAIKKAGKDAGLSGKNLFQPVRIGTTGAVHGPDLATILRLLGQEQVVRNLETVLKML